MAIYEQEKRLKKMEVTDMDLVEYAHNEAVSELTAERDKYKKAFDLLMDELWDSAPDECREHLDKELKKLGL